MPLSASALASSSECVVSAGQLTIVFDCPRLIMWSNVGASDIEEPLERLARHAFHVDREQRRRQAQKQQLARAAAWFGSPVSTLQWTLIAGMGGEEPGQDLPC